MPEQHIDTFFYLFPWESFPADRVDHLVNTGPPPFPANFADGILDDTHNVTLLLGDAGYHLVDIERPGPRIICDLAEAGIDDMDDALGIALLNSIRQTDACAGFCKPDQRLQLAGCDRYRLVRLC